MVHQVLAAQRGLHLGIQALAVRGRALLDRDHRLDRQVAQRGVGVVQVRDEPRQRLAPGQPAQRLQHRPPQQLVVQQLQQRRGRPRVADLAQGVDRRVLEPGLGCRAPRPAASTASADPIWPRLAAAAWRTLTSGSARAAISGGTARASRERAQHHRREVADLLVGVAQQREQRASRGAPSLT